MSSKYKTITHDASSIATQGTGSSFSWNHTVGSYNQRILIVSVAQQQNAVLRAVTGVTFNGVALTRAIYLGVTDASADLWYLVAPPVGTYAVAVTFDGSCGYCGGAGSFYNVEQISPVDTTGTANAATGTPTKTITTGIENALVCDAMFTASDGAWEPTESGQTKIWSHKVSVGDGGGGSYKITTTAGNSTMTWSAGGANGWIMAVASFKPALMDGGGFLLNFI